MIVKGINSDLYLINNPIWIDISELHTQIRHVEISLTDVTDPNNPKTSLPLKLYPFKSYVGYNLEEIIKSNFSVPQHPETIDSNVPIKTNYTRFRITISEMIYTYVTNRPRTGRPDIRYDVIYGEDRVGATVTFTKTFIRGGERSHKTNVITHVDAVLKESEKIPRWAGFPIVKYYVTTDKKIAGTKFIPNNEIDDRKVVGCDPLYVRFLNSKGGYSYWLFETYENKSKFTSEDIIKNRSFTTHFGHKTDDEIEAETRVPAEYNSTMLALMRSPEVHLYQRYGMEWARVIVADNDFSVNNYDSIQKTAVRFKLNLNETPSLIW